ncbi:hypothetical protein [Amycolatopsis echigonensis]|uniref:Uncharacterized protein n=1 Tax=Amycolatopsis echigonensis TaxID=2576905 RepID=A0A2N3WUH8_9PSEU|nr:MULTISPECIES: hypothetical protein [Amycolatopsis]MBB2497771.1 hypothetical protein [Amycolatopsis echigonensis]PKV97527.1 hypothetical protein ATK30_8510 [Amycolatopsis niigatensis]
MTDMPAYPSPSDGTPAAAPPRPAVITGAFWSFVAATVVGLAGAVFLFFARDTLTDAMRRANGQNATRLTEAQIDQAVTIGIVVGAVIAVVFALLHLLFAFKLRAGRNWARIVLTVLTALQVVSLLAGQGTVVSYVGAAFAVLGVVLSFLPEANQYIAAAKVRR